MSTAILLCGGCRPAAPANYQRSVDLAHAAVSQQDYSEAARYWGQAATFADTETDLHEAWFRQASNLKRSGDESGYWQLLERLARSPGPRQERAAFELARRDLEAGDRGAALEQAVVAHAGSGLAKGGLDTLLSSQTPPHRLATLKRVEDKITDPVLLERILFLRAQIYAQQGEPKTALVVYQELVQRYPYPIGRYWDEALLNQAVIYEQLGASNTAVGLLREMLSHQEAATLVGSYERRYAVARLLLARLLARTNWQQAHDLLAALLTTQPKSRLTDDGLWAAALLAHQNADAVQACADARRLSAQRSQSRYVACLHLVCASEKAQACRPYIVEQRSTFDAVIDLALQPYLGSQQPNSLPE